MTKDKIRCPFCKTQIEIDLAEETLKEMEGLLDADKPTVTIEVHFSDQAGFGKWFALAQLKALKDVLTPICGNVRISWEGSNQRNFKYAESGVVGEPGMANLEGDGSKVRFSIG